MNRLILVLLAFGLLLSPAANTPLRAAQATTDSTAPQNETVYITRTGRKYHKAGCRYLRYSAIPVKRKDAIANGYTPCSVCGG
jgi:hypothetical protein